MNLDNLKAALRKFGIELLAAPQAPVGQSSRFSAVNASLVMKRFGAFGPLGDLEANWAGVEAGAAAELQQLAQEAGTAIITKYPDCYNGVLPRLVSWKVSVNPKGGQQLDLGLEATTFATWRVTNGNPSLPQHLRDALAANGNPDIMGGHHLPLTVGMVTRDDRILLMQRASGMAVHPDAYGSAANGNVDLEARGVHASDIDKDGHLNLLAAGAREAIEELGAGLDVSGQSLKAVALMRYTDTREWGSPVLILEARTGLTVPEVIQGLAYSHPTEGVGELGRHVISIPLQPVNLTSVVEFVVGEHMRGSLTAPAAASTLLALADACGADKVAVAMENAGEKKELPAEVSRIVINVPNSAGHAAVGY